MVWLCKLVSLKATQYLLLFYRTQVRSLYAHVISSLTTFRNFMSRPCWKLIELGQGLNWIVGPGYSFGVFLMSRFAPPALSSVDDPKMLCLKRGFNWPPLIQKFTSRTWGSNWPFRCLDLPLQIRIFYPMLMHMLGNMQNIQDMQNMQKQSKQPTPGYVKKDSLQN